jgi:uncharacterized Fe-S cluster-containing protein
MLSGIVRKICSVTDLHLADDVVVVPANLASCDDLLAVFGSRGASAGCDCQRYKLAPGEALPKFPRAERAARLRHQTA